MELCSKYVLILGSADKSVSNTEMATPRGSLARPKVIQKVKVMETVPTTRSLRSARVVIPLGMSSLLESAGRCLLEPAIPRAVIWHFSVTSSWVNTD